MNNADGSKGGGPRTGVLTPPLAIGPAGSLQAGASYGPRQFFRNFSPYDQNDHMKMVIMGIDLPASLSYGQTFLVDSNLKARASLLRKSRINLLNQTVESSKCKTWQERPEPFFTGCKTVVVLMELDETEEQAWRKHIKKHPEDIHADVRIFHVT